MTKVTGFNILVFFLGAYGGLIIGHAIALATRPVNRRDPEPSSQPSIAVEAVYSTTDGFRPTSPVVGLADGARVRLIVEGDVVELKPFFDLFAANLRDYQAYHARKETMSWFVATAAIGASATIVFGPHGQQAAWQNLDTKLFVPFFLFLVLTAAVAFWLLLWLNEMRMRGGALVQAVTNVFAAWAYAPPQVDAMRPVLRFEDQNDCVPRALDDEYRRQRSVSRLTFREVIGFVVVGGWGVVALARVLLKW